MLHPTTHELIVSKELDREQRSEYELIIRYVLGGYNRLKMIISAPISNSLINLRFIISFRATEECQTFLSEESNKEISGDGGKVTFDPLDDSLLLVKVRFHSFIFFRNYFID